MCGYRHRVPLNIGMGPAFLRVHVRQVVPFEDSFCPSVNGTPASVTRSPGRSRGVGTSVSPRSESLIGLEPVSLSSVRGFFLILPADLGGSI